MKSRYEIKDNAKELIKKNNLWLTIGLVQAILSILTISIYFKDASIFTENHQQGFSYLLPSLLSGLFQLCTTLYLQKVVDGTKNVRPGFINQLNDIFNSISLKTFLTDLISNLFIVAWVLIPIVGIFISILKNYSYGLSIYIANNENDNDYTSYITNSRNRMNGHKMDWFIQHLSFIPWTLLVLITGGLANLYVYPYITAADVIFANQVLNEKKDQ